MNLLKITLMLLFLGNIALAQQSRYEYGKAGNGMGFNSEGIRNTIQNRWIHNWVNSPHFPMVYYNRTPLYFNNATNYRYSLW